MKKLAAMLLILVLSVSMLVGCDEVVIGEYDYPDYVPVYVKEIDLNLYIIGGNPDGKAITTVKREITAYTSAKFKINLDVKYFTEDEYNAKVSEDLANNEKSVDIVLINNATTFKELASAGRLVALDSFLASKEYGTLNASIAKPLLEASMYTQGETSSLLCVPNNRVLGSYKYLKIDRAEGHAHGYSKSELDSMTTEAQVASELAELEKMLADGKIEQEAFDQEKAKLEGMLCVEELSAKIVADGKNPDDYITIVENGKYETKAELEAEGYACVILEYPKVTSDDAYSSAFAITTDCEAENYARAMDIIYAINNDVYFHNLLAFGVKNTNYYLDDDNFVTYADGEGAYNMDLKYVGDLFVSYFVEGVYTPQTKLYGEQQNAQASYEAPVVDEP